MAGRSQSRGRQSKKAPWLFAAICGFCTLFALSYMSVNSSSWPQRFPSPQSCPRIADVAGPRLHVLLLSYARSGSSFLGDLLQSYSGTFYYFEPLHYFGDVIAPSYLPAARKMIRDFLTCNFFDWGAYPEWVWYNPNFLTLQRNRRYWASCSARDKSRPLCYNVCFMSARCRNSSARILKTIRLPFREALHLLRDGRDLNLKVIHLIRDPRGTMNSRMQKEIAKWCSKSTACASSKTFCSLVEEDLQHACDAQRMFPDNYMFLRYEDLALAPLLAAERIFRFLGVGPVPREVVEFLETHTQGTSSSSSVSSYLLPAYRTVRNSTQTATAWYRKLDMKHVLKVQMHCRGVLDKLGYAVVRNRSELAPEDVVQDSGSPGKLGFCLET